MQQSRYNIFNQIHKGLRAMLYDTALRIQQTDFSQEEQAVPTMLQLEKLLVYFDQHADHEDEFILPAIRKHAKLLVEELESEHVTDHALSHSLNKHIKEWRSSLNENVKRRAGFHMLYDFNSFVAFNLYHMNKEELLFNQVLWEHYTDEEIFLIEHALISTIPPDMLVDESRWIMRGINNEEVIGWLNGVKNNAPPEVFAVFMALAEEELPANRLKDVQESLTEGILLA